MLAGFGESIVMALRKLRIEAQMIDYLRAFFVSGAEVCNTTLDT
jgi:hypothetical protein